MQEVFEKIIEELEENQTIVFHNGKPMQSIDFVEAIEIVKQVAIEYNNDWIRVKERLPERNKPVLVYAESKTISGGTITMVGACDNGFWFIQDGVDTLGFPCRDYKVIAWQSLPEYISRRESETESETEIN